MLPIPRSAALAALAVTSGAALFGVAAGGVAAVDRDLQATAPAVRFENVDFRPAGECPFAAPRPRSGREV